MIQDLLVSIQYFMDFLQLFYIDPSELNQAGRADPLPIFFASMML
jgi:hypothetical protein